MDFPQLLNGMFLKDLRDNISREESRKFADNADVRLFFCFFSLVFLCHQVYAFLSLPVFFLFHLFLLFVFFTFRIVNILVFCCCCLV